MPSKFTKLMRKDDIIIKDTHRALRYEDGVLVKILEAGRYEFPRLKWYEHLVPEHWRRRLPKIELALVDIRERDLTIKGQEILTADKVAIRVSIIVQFKVRIAVSAARLHVLVESNVNSRVCCVRQFAKRVQFPQAQQRWM